MGILVAFYELGYFDSEEVVALSSCLVFWPIILVLAVVIGPFFCVGRLGGWFVRKFK